MQTKIYIIYNIYNIYIYKYIICFLLNVSKLRQNIIRSRSLNKIRKIKEKEKLFALLVLIFNFQKKNIYIYSWHT